MSKTGSTPLDSSGHSSEENLVSIEPPIRDGDFSDYMWMEKEEEFDTQVLKQLEEDELVEDCLEAMGEGKDKGKPDTDTESPMEENKGKPGTVTESAIIEDKDKPDTVTESATEEGKDKGKPVTELAKEEDKGKLVTESVTEEVKDKCKPDTVTGSAMEESKDKGKPDTVIESAIKEGKHDMVAESLIGEGKTKGKTDNVTESVASLHISNGALLASHENRAGDKHDEKATDKQNQESEAPVSSRLKDDQSQNFPAKGNQTGECKDSSAKEGSKSEVPRPPVVVSTLNPEAKEFVPRRKIAGGTTTSGNKLE